MFKSPEATSVERLNHLESKKANKGIILYCATNPIKTNWKDLITLTKSSTFKVMPILIMVSVKADVTCGRNQRKVVGLKNPMILNIMT